jgi:hypothetical protein
VGHSPAWYSCILIDDIGVPIDSVDVSVISTEFGLLDGDATATLGRPNIAVVKYSHDEESVLCAPKGSDELSPWRASSCTGPDPRISRPRLFVASYEELTAFCPEVGDASATSAEGIVG